MQGEEGRGGEEQGKGKGSGTLSGVWLCGCGGYPFFCGNNCKKKIPIQFTFAA